MIHFNKLGSYTITNTMVSNRNTWINDQDPEFIISWCGQFWHIGHRGEAGQCTGYVSSPDNKLCFQSVQDIRWHLTVAWTETLGGFRECNFEAILLHIFLSYSP